jgi:hypothetical protein
VSDSQAKDKIFYLQRYPTAFAQESIMASPEDVYREFTKRTHRTMATYLAIVAWTRDLDCVVIDREEIVRFWGLSKRVEKQRLEWLKSDIQHFFPYVEALNFTSGTKKFGSLYFARRQFPKKSFDAAMADKKRALSLTEKGFHTELVPVPTELEIMTQ